MKAPLERLKRFFTVAEDFRLENICGSAPLHQTSASSYIDRKIGIPNIELAGRHVPSRTEPNAKGFRTPKRRESEADKVLKFCSVKQERRQAVKVKYNAPQYYERIYTTHD